MITFRLSDIPLEGIPGYVKRRRGGATVILDRARFTRDQAAALTALTAAAVGDGVFGFWEGEIVPLEESDEADLPLEHPVQ